MTANSLQIGIVGGGVAGLFSAWYLARLGGDAVSVTILERGAVGHGSSWDAAGMLAPVNELEFQEVELFRAGLASRKLYDSEVADALGDIGMRREGTVEIGLQGDDTQYLRRLFDFQRENGQEVEWLNGAALREREPYLAQHVACGIWSWLDAQVDNRKLVGQLEADCRARGVVVRAQHGVQGWQRLENGGVTVQTTQGEFKFDKLLACPGVPSAELQELLPYKIYPVRGEMVALQPPTGPHAEFLKTTVRIRSQIWGNAYLVPKNDRLLCGSTAEEKGLVRNNTAGGLLDILRKCYAAVPGIYELDVQEIWAGMRPATLNRLPLLDREGDSGIYHLNGLYRHGILLGPLMGKAAATLILEGKRLSEIDPFTLLQ